MAIKLYKYQDKALKEMMVASENLLNSGQKSKYILLKSITGSGKTVIASAYIQEMFKAYDNIAFVWISVGKGGLHIQSRDSLSEKLPADIRIKMADEALRNYSLNHKDVLVLSWDSLNDTKVDENTGEEKFTNIFMKDGEQRNVRELCENTISSGVKIILMIDESHHTAKSETSKKIINDIGPEFIVELTATPLKERIPNKEDEVNQKAFYIPVQSKDVIAEEIIKKSIKLNEFSTDNEYDSTLEMMIAQSSLKRKNLAKAFREEGRKVNPLCLIQLPDSKIGEKLKEDVLNELQNLGYTVSNKKVAIWLSNEKYNLEDITDLNSGIDFLIFKQAVATGWDCPRASILVKLRDSKSTIFDLQTVGRILRMPERVHYDTKDELNHGYVYTNSEYTINTGDYDMVLPLKQTLKSDYKDSVKNIVFITEKIEYGDATIDGRTLENAFLEKMNRQSLNENINELSLALTTSSVDVKEFDKEAKSNVDKNIAGERSFIMKSKDVALEYERFVKSFADRTLPYKTITNVLKRFFEKKVIDSISYSDIKKMVLLNKTIISQCIYDIKKEYKNTIPTYLRSKGFSFKEDRHTIEKDMVEYKKCAYFKHFKSKYDTEVAFEEYLEENSNVYWWIKNADSGDGLSIVYSYEKVKHEFYPDYIVMFKSGDIGIYETKDINDKEKETITKEKILKLKDYANEYNYKCGLIEIKDKKVYKPTLPKELR